jgi:hypothetical protein
MHGYRTPDGDAASNPRVSDESDDPLPPFVHHVITDHGKEIFQEVSEDQSKAFVARGLIDSCADCSVPNDQIEYHRVDDHTWDEIWEAIDEWEAIEE